jgi:hypothetical protein
VFEIKVVRRIFGPRRDDISGGQRKLHNKEVRKLHSSPGIIRRFKWRGSDWHEM